MSKRSVNDLSRQTSSSKMDIQKDIMFKMSKKIAQLTKVIYYLNTKNEDIDLMMKNSAIVYESELSETVNYGAVIIQELQAKLKDVEIRMDMQNNMLKQNAESIANSKKKLKVAEEALHNAKEVAQQRITATKEILKEKIASEVDLTAKVHSLQKDRQNFETQSFSSAEQHKIEIETLKATHEQALADSMEESLQITSKLKHKIRSLESRNDEIEIELLKKRADLADIKSVYDLREEKIREETEMILNRMRENLENEAVANDEKSQTILRLNSDIEKKKEMVEEMESCKFEAETIRVKLEETIEMLNGDQNLLNKDIKCYKETILELEAKVPTLENDLKDTQDSLSNLQENHLSLKFHTDQLQKAFDDVQIDISEAKEKLIVANVNIAKLDESIVNLQGIIEKNDSQIVRLKTQLVQDAKDNQVNLEFRMNELKVRMEKEREEEVLRRSEEIMRQKDATIYYMKKDLDNLSKRLQELGNEHEQENKDLQDVHSKLERTLNAKMADLDNVISGKQAKIKELKDLVDDKNKTISDNMAVIKTHEALIKSLEADINDMFQKMVQIDKQVRIEMNEEFAKDKSELEITWNNKHLDEMDLLRKDMDAKFNHSSIDMLARVKSQADEELKQVHEIYAVKGMALAEELSEKQKQISTLKRDIDALERHIREMAEGFEKKEIHIIEAFNTKIDNLNDKHRSEMEELQFKAKEEMSQLMHSIDSKHEGDRAELVASHRKQVDDLRNFFSVSTINAKRDAESARSNEIHKLHSQNEQEKHALIQKNKAQLEESIQKLRSEKDQEISELIDEYEGRIANLKNDYEEANFQFLTLTSVEAQLRQEYDSLAIACEEKKQELSKKEKELRRAGKEFDTKVVKLNDDFAIKLRNHADQLKGKHINEMQMMLQEFEKAKNYLKTEISSKNQSLEEAAIKYTNREPRQADLETIANLKKEMDSQNSHIDGLKKQLFEFSLEMNNREASFNKIFNNIPIVGMIQPRGGTKKDYTKILKKLPPLSLLTNEERAKSASTTS